jgi:hypothetical protein
MLRFASRVFRQQVALAELKKPKMLGLSVRGSALSTGISLRAATQLGRRTSVERHDQKDQTSILHVNTTRASPHLVGEWSKQKKASSEIWTLS